MSAAHRGDMYHIRAAMATKPRGIILYESDKAGKTKDVEDYLTIGAFATGFPILIVTWSRDDLLNGPKGELDPTGCTLGSKPTITPLTPADVLLEGDRISFISEGAATEIIARSVVSPAIMSTMSEMMALPASAGLDKARAALETEFVKIVEENHLFKDVKKEQKTVLILFRDTGSLGGAYPELDSGDAIKDFVFFVSSLAMTPMLAGNPKLDSKFPSIGEYWLLLTPLVKDTELPKRDVEAYFMKWAHQKGYFDMVLGFRSGVLDSFTFLGIPTVSVGLRHLAGEDRHVLLAKEIFKRVNVAYDQPRHKATAWVQTRSKDTKGPPVLLQSPYWLPGAHAPVSVTPRPDEDHAKSLAEPPSVFHGFDAKVLDMGLRMACEKDMKMPKTVGIYGPETRALNVSTARCTYYLAKTTTDEDKASYFSDLEALDSKTCAERSLPERVATLQERAVESKAYLDEADRDWAKLHNDIDPTFSEYLM
jgi:hypothetical protein